MRKVFLPVLVLLFTFFIPFHSVSAQLNHAQCLDSGVTWYNCDNFLQQHVLSCYENGIQGQSVRSSFWQPNQTGYGFECNDPDNNGLDATELAACKQNFSSYVCTNINARTPWWWLSNCNNWCAAAESPVQVNNQTELYTERIGRIFESKYNTIAQVTPTPTPIYISPTPVVLENNGDGSIYTMRYCLNSLERSTASCDTALATANDCIEQVPYSDIGWGTTDEVIRQLFKDAIRNNPRLGGTCADDPKHSAPGGTGFFPTLDTRWTQMNTARRTNPTNITITQGAVDAEREELINGPTRNPINYDELFNPERQNNCGTLAEGANKCCENESVAELPGEDSFRLPAPPGSNTGVMGVSLSDIGGWFSDVFFRPFKPIVGFFKNQIEDTTRNFIPEDGRFYCNEGSTYKEFEDGIVSKCTCINASTRLEQMCKNIKPGSAEEIAKSTDELSLCVNCVKKGFWTGIGCIDSDFQSFIQKTVFGWGLGLAGVTALLCVIYASFRMQMSANNAEQIKGAQELLTSCITGLIVILFSVVILRIIGVDILRLPFLQ